MPRVSVILTSYNHEKYIREAIESALAQTFHDFELIIWDDASADNSWQVIKSYVDPRIRAFRNNERRRGVFGINKAISKITSGEYIAIHHSDDIWEPDKLAKQVAFLDANQQIGAVFTNALAIGEDSAPLNDPSHFYSIIFDQPNRNRHDWLNLFFNRGNALCHPSVLIRRECYDRCGLYRFGFAQVTDFDMWIRLCMKYEIYVLPERLVRFRVRANEANASGSRPETRCRITTEYYMLMKNYLKIDSFEELAAIFPEAKKYYRSGGSDLKYVLAMVALDNRPHPFVELFGLELLFQLLADRDRTDTIKTLYNFDYRDLIDLTGKHDGFSMETVFTLYQAIASKDQEIGMLNQVVAERDARVTEHNRIIDERDAQVAEHSRTIAERDRQIVERDGQIAELNRAVAAHEVVIGVMTASRSWRITRSLRFVARLLRGQWEVIFSSFRNTRNVICAHSINKLAVASPKAAAAPSDITKFAGKRILLVSYYCPTRYHAGGLRILDIYSILRKINPNGQIDLYTIKRPDIDRDYTELEDMFDHIFFSEKETLTLEELARLNGEPMQYDIIDLQFHQAAFDIKNFKTIAGKIVFTPMELLLRALSIELRRCVISPRTLSIAKLKNLVNFSIQEIRMTRLADLSICVSEPDARFLRQGALCTSVQSLETGLSPFEFEYELSDNYLLYPVESKQKTVLYMAYFGSETNILALEWFVQNVHPLIKERVADYSLLVAGRGDLSRFRKFEDGNLEIMGEFESVAAIASQAKVGIAPALSGSGFRGKINQYAICGVPCVASPIAAEGLAYQNGSQIFVESSPRLFAERCVSLMTDNALNQAVRSAAREVCLNNYTWESKLRETRSIYEIEDPPKIPIHGKVTAIVPSYNHGQFLVDRIKSIQEQTYRNIELIVVDDCSTDDSDAVIREMMSIKPFMYLRTPVNSGSPFGPWKQALERAAGDYIWICESDDFCAPDFVEHAMRCMSTHPDAALFYCSSKIVNENNEVIGHTDAYFHDIWKESRWDHDFKSKGRIEIADFQVRGQTVPNLSSAIFSADAFGKALGTDLTNFRLTGDWLFVARIMQFGDVLYSREVKNCYRSHNNTARNRVDSARSQAEFIITKSIIFRLSGFPVSRFAGIMSSDAVRFIHEEPKWHEVIRQMISVSITESLRCLGLLTCSLMMNPVYLKAYISRLKLARSIGRVEVNGKN